MRYFCAKPLPLLFGAALISCVAAAPWAEAQTGTTPPAPTTTTPAPAAPAAPKSWYDTINLSGYIEGGFTGNFQSPKSDLNFGHLFTDKSNEGLFNQGSLIFERPVDTSGGFDWGFRFQGMMGTDARYTHFLGEGDRATTNRIQYDIVEASITAHTPYFTAGGEELKIGQFPTLMGEEVIDPRSNIFYSHSYLFNFGVPLKDTGVMLTTHVNPLIDVYTGIVTGANTSIGYPGGDNNGAVAFEGGIGFNISDSLNILVTTNIGPENPCGVAGASYSCNSSMRYYGDLVAVWKINPKLTSITELNIVHDQGPFISADGGKYSPTAGGVAQYLVWQWTDQIALAGRAEIFRDANGFFVAAFPGNFDFVNSEVGRPFTAFGPFAPTTYGELTVGLSYKPAMPDPFKGFVIRPELRIDDALGGPNAFNIDQAGVAHSKTQETAAIDFVLPF